MSAAISWQVITITTSCDMAYKGNCIMIHSWLVTEPSLNILKVVFSFHWGADRKTLLKLYDSLCRSKLEYAFQIYSSACKSKLKELDVVHNLRLHICTGALRSSPVESIYVDSNELTLDLRREELGIRYIQRIKSNPQNPTFKVLGSCDSNLFNKPRSTKPFQVCLNEDVEDESLKAQKNL